MGKKLIEKLRQKRKELADRSSGGQFFTIKEGTTRMRAVPVGKEKDFAVEVVYFFLGRKVGGVVSPATFGKFCPIMKKYNELSSSKKSSERDLASRMKPSKKFMILHIKYKDQKGKDVDDQAGVKPLLLTPGQYQEVLDLYLEIDEAGDFTDPREGYDIKYSRTGKGKTDTRYTLIPCRPSPIPKKYNKIYDPIKAVKGLILDKDSLKQKLADFLNAPPDEDDDAPQNKKKSKKKSKSRDL